MIVKTRYTYLQWYLISMIISIYVTQDSKMSLMSQMAFIELLCSLKRGDFKLRNDMKIFVVCWLLTELWPLEWLHVTCFKRFGFGENLILSPKALSSNYHDIINLYPHNCNYTAFDDVIIVHVNILNEDKSTGLPMMCILRSTVVICIF